MKESVADLRKSTRVGSGLFGLRFAFAVLGILLLALVPAALERSPGPSDLLDPVERELEMGRHERLVLIKAAQNSVLADFTTDGCSGGLSAGWDYVAQRLPAFRDRHGESPPWEDCCVVHDRLYHTGGPRDATATESFDARRAADLGLKVCVLETGVVRTPELMEEYGLSADQVGALYKTVAELMYRAVRVGGIPCSGLPWRWGYGWPECDSALASPTSSNRASLWMFPIESASGQ